MRKLSVIANVKCIYYSREVNSQCNLKLKMYMKKKNVVPEVKLFIGYNRKTQLHFKAFYEFLK